MIALVKYGLVALAGASVPTVIAVPVTTVAKEKLKQAWEKAKEELEKQLNKSKQDNQNLNTDIEKLKKSIDNPGIADILKYFDKASEVGLENNIKEYGEMSERIAPEAKCLLTETTTQGSNDKIYLWSCKHIKKA